MVFASAMSSIRLLAEGDETSANLGPWVLLGFALAILATMLAVGRVLSRQSEALIDPAIVRTFNRRISAWILISVLLALTLICYKEITVFFFFIISFWALREFITLAPTRRADHRTLFWVLVLFTPLQYVLVAMTGLAPPDPDAGTQRFLFFDLNFEAYRAIHRIVSYEIFVILIPVYVTLFIAARIAFTGDRKRYLERIAKIQFGLLICVYALSHAPALLYLNVGQRSTLGSEVEPWHGSNTGLLFFFIILVQFSDLVHFLCDKIIGRHVIAPQINATKTWEGLIGAACIAAIAGMVIELMDITPFNVYGAGVMAFIISLMGSSGSMSMSAIKRDRGVEDYGTLITGHAGVLDRIDSICFAAPIFYHVTRFFLDLEL